MSAEGAHYIQPQLFKRHKGGSSSASILLSTCQDSLAWNNSGSLNFFCCSSINTLQLLCLNEDAHTRTPHTTVHCAAKSCNCKRRKQPRPAGAIGCDRQLQVAPRQLWSSPARGWHRTQTQTLCTSSAGPELWAVPLRLSRQVAIYVAVE